MCGISGIYSLSNKPIKNLKSRLKLMTDLLHHRGPDQKGIYTSENNTFGLSKFLANNEKLLFMIICKMNVTKTPDAIPVISPTFNVIISVTKKMMSCSLPIENIFFTISGEANL